MKKYQTSTLLALFSLALMGTLPSQVKADNLTGTVQFGAFLELNAYWDGTVTQVYAKVGDQVSAGEVLIEFDSTRQEAKVEMAKNQVARQQINVDTATAEFARQQELFEQGSLSTLLLEEARNALRMAQSRLASAQARLRTAQHQLTTTSKIVAPVDAIVVNSRAYTGMNIHPELSSRPLMAVTEVGQYVVQVIVSPERLQRLLTNNSLHIVVGDTTYPTTVGIPTLLPTSSPGELTYLVQLKFTEHEVPVLPGTLATVRLD